MHFSSYRYISTFEFFSWSIYFFGVLIRHGLVFMFLLFTFGIPFINYMSFVL